MLFYPVGIFSSLLEQVRHDRIQSSGELARQTKGLEQCRTGSVRGPCVDQAAWWVIARISASSPGPLGLQPSHSRVSTLDAYMSLSTKAASQPKCPAASSALMERTATPAIAPMAS